MPDHVHVVFTPLINELKREIYSLAEIMDGIKGASSHLINRALNRGGKVWQTESFDRALRSYEKLDEKILYILDNPVRKSLVSKASEYQWGWAADPEIGTVVPLRTTV